MKIACGVTLYHPDLGILEKIKNYADVFDAVYLYDNTENYARDDLLTNEIKKLCSCIRSGAVMSESVRQNKIVYISNGKNDGLPEAFNYIIHSLDDDMEFLCTLDQDSQFDNQEIREMRRVLKKISNRIAIVAPFVAYAGEDYQKSHKLLKRKWVITSGSFVNLTLLRKEHMSYDAAYFIDKFEIDLCEQFRQKGYTIAMYLGAVLFQQLGETDSKGRTNYSALRHYYLFRNRFYFNNKFFGFPKKQVLNLLQLGRHIERIIFREEGKFAKVTQLFPATRDYLSNRMGERHNGL